MVQLGLDNNFGSKILEWYEKVVPMKDTGSFLGKLTRIQYDIREVVIQTRESASTRETTEFFVNIIDRTYEKYDLEEVDTSEV